MTAISWTYIVIAEAIGGEAGIGALTWRVGLRRGRIDKVFCLLIIIMLVGIFQDKIFGYLDKKLFPHKYQQKDAYAKIGQDDESIISTIWSFTGSVLPWIGIGSYFILVLDEYFGLLGHLDLLSYLFKDTIWVIHIVVIFIVVFKLYTSGFSLGISNKSRS